MKAIMRYVVASLKYTNLPNDQFDVVIDAPVGAKPISVLCNGDTVAIYLEAEPIEKTCPIRFVCCATGTQVPAGADHFESIIVKDRAWHFYLRRPCTAEDVLLARDQNKSPR
jgi:hypothetical protein